MDLVQGRNHPVDLRSKFGVLFGVFRLVVFLPAYGISKPLALPAYGISKPLALPAYGISKPLALPAYGIFKPRVPPVYGLGQEIAAQIDDGDDE